MIDSREKVEAFYQNNIYGQWRNGEKVTYKVKSAIKPREEIRIEITVKKNDREGSFTVKAFRPEDKCKSAEGFPFIVCMHPVSPLEYALDNGVAMIFLDTSMVAEDNNLRKGCFYDVYPYGEDAQSQTGVLMAWGWAAAKVLDAIECGLGEELGLNAAESAVTGVSRWGKATAVCGAFESRFKTVIPVCSGAGGLALWSYSSEGQKYDLTCCGGPSEYIYGVNEPLSCLQSEAERGWFNDAFLRYERYEDIEVDQYMLPVLAAAPNRQYVIVAAWMGEDWVNAPAMWECYNKAKAIYDNMGLSDHIHAVFHKEGHALLQEDLEKIFEF